MMIDETEVRSRLAEFVAVEPPFGPSLPQLLATARKDRRRRTALATVAGTVLAVAASAGLAHAYEGLVTDGTGATAPASGGQAHHQARAGGGRPATASSDIPAALRAVVAEQAPDFSKETAMQASTWEAYTYGPGGDPGPPVLPASQYDSATSWTAVFELSDGTGRLLFELDHLPPDKPATIFGADCGPYPNGDCSQSSLPDGRGVVESYSANQLRQGGGFLTDHAVQVVDGSYRVMVTEEITDATTPNAHQDYRLTPQQLRSLASDRSLVFPEPDPLPTLPSWERCLYSSDPPPSCP
ncbi:MAG: hypothetical protein ACR2KL_02210 [Nocardioidaceae bacterium]